MPLMSHTIAEPATMKATYHPYLAVFLCLLLTAGGCVGGKHRISVPAAGRQGNLNPLGYTIQIGAFSNPDNAARLTDSLEQQGIDAYYFVHRSGLYKVRFGNFPTREAATLTAAMAATIRAASTAIWPAHFRNAALRHSGGRACACDTSRFTPLPRGGEGDASRPPQVGC